MAFGIGGSAVAETATAGSKVESQAGLPTIVSPVGIASTNAFGTLHSRQSLRPVGITSRSTLGTITGRQSQRRPTGIASTLAFGVPVVVHQASRGSVVVPASIASGLKFGTTRAFFRGQLGHVLPVGISSGSRVGTLRATVLAPIIPPTMSPHTLWQLLNYGSPQVSLQEKPRLVTLQFGDGYAQRLGDGLTPIDRTLTLSWDMLDTAQADVIVSVLRSWTGYALSFVAPREKSPRKWLVKTWDRQSLTAGIDSMTATFEERLYEGPLQ